MTVTFADVVHQSIAFSRDVPAHRVALDLIDTQWFQRLRDISQTANTRLVYMFSEHSRFGHSVGVAYLANLLMEKLAHNHPREIEPFRVAVSAAAALHDIGHIAPGSHIAYKIWFPEQQDGHEAVAIRIIDENEEIRSMLSGYGPGMAQTVTAILKCSSKLPPWTWEIISGGGWNVDRGNWCIADSVLAGVTYGKYNIPALTESIVITDDRHLALRENRLDAMMHFALSRHAMYRQVYQHRVLLAADMINRAIVQRLRDIRPQDEFCDEAMRAVLNAGSVEDLPVSTLFAMRESWWRYHLLRWLGAKDPILRDLCDRAINRKLFKTVRIPERIPDSAVREDLIAKARAAVSEAGFDPRYYLHTVSTLDMHAGDSQHTMQVLMDDGTRRTLSEAEPLYEMMVRETKPRAWLALPAQAKQRLGVLR